MSNCLYKTPKTDMEFVLHDVLELQQVLTQHIPDVTLDQETLSQIMDGAHRFCSNILAPLNAPGDRIGCTVLGDEVKTPDGFKQAYQHYIRDGWSGLTSDTEHGGQALPMVTSTILGEMLAATNISWSLYPRLSEGVYRCLRANASTSIKNKYLPKLASGQWTGTMCLTESHAGTDLGLLRTKAQPADNGDFLITGTKMFISSGDHDLASNIVHLVLARLPDAPAGTRGISLFVVPKFLSDASGEITKRNAVYCDSIEDKLGLRGNATCTLRFENAYGQLVGEPHRGLAAMFVMMNTARLGTGTQALGLGEMASQKAFTYAQERLQSRGPDTKRDQSTDPDPIIQQPDVRRMLMAQKSWVQGSRMFLYWIALQIDIQAYSHDTEAQKQAQSMLALLTPIAKAFVSDNAVQTVNMGLQIHGGSGYIVETGIEQIWRDVRILPIYEGTNGVQAYDLLARKVVQDKGVMLNIFMNYIHQYIDQNTDLTEMAPYCLLISSLIKDINDFVDEIMTDEDNLAVKMSFAATDFLRLMGLLVFGFFWLRAAIAVLRKRKSDDPLRLEKLALAKYFFEYQLPEKTAIIQKLGVSPDVIMTKHAIV